MKGADSRIDTAKIFRALSNETRLRVLMLLRDGPLCANAIVNRVAVSQPAISQHLKILEGTGFVKAKKIGYWVHYAIVPKAFADCIDCLTEFSKVSAKEKKCENTGITTKRKRRKLPSRSPRKI